MNKKNEYIVVRRHKRVFDEIDMNEFEDCIRGYLNMGFILVGGFSICQTDLSCIISQAIHRPVVKGRIGLL